MTKLSVNVNKVATLRNTRTIGIPSVVHAAKLCLDAGAHGITVHPRPDARHIRPHDVYDIAKLLKKYKRAEYNIEGNPFIEYMRFAREVRPTQCTLVPDTPEAFTSNQGWNMPREVKRLKTIIAKLRSYGCRVSIFLDPVPQWCELAKDAGADRIELYTEPYASAFSRGEKKKTLAKYVATAKRALEVGLEINAGHDLNRDNLPLFLTKVPGVEEVSIGHALIGDALEFGLPETVKKYLQVIRGAAKR
jgi:pyridoxine 5-phosphate synthase